MAYNFKIYPNSVENFGAFAPVVFNDLNEVYSYGGPSVAVEISDLNLNLMSTVWVPNPFDADHRGCNSIFKFGHIYALNQQLGIYDLNGMVKKWMTPDGSNVYYAVSNGNFCYVISANNKIYTLDLNTFSIVDIKTGFGSASSIYLTINNNILLNQADGSFFDISGGIPKIIFKLNKYIRGYVIIDKYMIVGSVTDSNLLLYDISNVYKPIMLLKYSVPYNPEDLLQYTKDNLICISEQSTKFMFVNIKNILSPIMYSAIEINNFCRGLTRIGNDIFTCGYIASKGYYIYKFNLIMDNEPNSDSLIIASNNINSSGNAVNSLTNFSRPVSIFGKYKS